MTNYVSGGRMWHPSLNVQGAVPLNRDAAVTRAVGWALVSFGMMFFAACIYLSISRHFAWEYYEPVFSPNLLNILVNEAPNNILVGFAVCSTITVIIGAFQLLALSNIQRKRKVNPLRHGWQNSILLFIVVVLGVAASGTILSTNDSATAIHTKSVASFESWMKSKGLDVTHEQAVDVVDAAWGYTNSNMYAVKTLEKPLVIDGKTHTVEIAKRGDNNLFFSVDTKKNTEDSIDDTSKVNW